MARNESILKREVFHDAMMDPEYCLPFLEIVTGFWFQKVEHKDVHHDTDMLFSDQSVVLDAYVQDDDIVYDVELILMEEREEMKGILDYTSLLEKQSTLGNSQP